MVGFVYDRYSCALRRIIFPDRDDQLTHTPEQYYDRHKEGLVVAPVADGTSIAAGEQAIIRATGRIPFYV